MKEFKRSNRNLHFMAEGRMRHPQAIQLTNLSSVLKGLESGASLMRNHVHQAMIAVQSGTYHIDSLQLSRRIIYEALS